MRRLALLALTVATGIVLALAASGGAQNSAQDGPTSGDLRVDAIFDTAKGIVPGQLVKVAGARVGEVSEVVLTPDHQARIQLSIDPRFAPFRQDARCEIQPEGLISENFVQCDPGTPSAPALEGENGQAPTVPIERTAVPVNLTDLFEIWEVPVRDRLRIILTSLGAGVAGRGEDLNALLRRANPTLGLVRQAVEAVDDQRDDLVAAIENTRQVTRELSREPEQLRAFVSETSDALSLTARRRAELREGTRRLPALLAAAKPALADLDRLAAAGTPLARRLRAAAPDLDALVAEVPAAARPALPALQALGATARRGRGTVKAAKPVVRLLRTFARAALPAGDELEKTFVDLRERGFVEGLLSFVYHATAASARYDAVSHMLPAHLQITTCSQFADGNTTAACDGNYNRPAPASRRRSGKRRSPAPREAAPRRPSPPATRPQAEPGARPPAPLELPKVPGPVGDVVEGVLDALGLGPKGDAKAPLGDLLRPRSGSRDQGADKLLDLLLGP